MKNLLPYCALLFVLSCSPTKLRFERPVNTTSRPISIQDKKQFAYPESDVVFSNDFDGARLNGVIQENDSTYRLRITPENIPINNSAYYAFKIKSTKAQNLYLQFDYPPPYTHRYVPKINRGNGWTVAAGEFINTIDGRTQLKLTKVSGTVLVSAQELQNSGHVAQWAEAQQAKNSMIDFKSIGESTLGRPIWVMDIQQGNAKGKPVIVFFTRQHPPEVTGYLAFKAFMEELLSKTDLSDDFFDQYHILAFPLVNPDGVDLGHWRHNAGGVDTNRDWSKYRQPETRAIVKYIEKTLRKEKANLVLGLDFHSTWYDVFYTNKERQSTPFPNFLDQWFSALEARIPNYKVNEKASNSTQPVSKGWLLYGHNAVGVTYEIGDETPRDSIQLIGQTSAKALMEILVEEKQ
ncbi:MAG: M14 family metallopeptidase [Flavobacteriaceae bacterium]|nr:M14 family metallopeptidase [Flavobacteriaceae bacterium]